MVAAEAANSCAWELGWTVGSFSVLGALAASGETLRETRDRLATAQLHSGWW